jgi:hypothetical protein
MIRTLIAFTLLLIFGSCAKNIHVNYQTGSNNANTIVLKPLRVTEATYVTLNDKLVVDKKLVKSVTINNLPAGEYKVNYASDNIFYKHKLFEELTIQIDSVGNTTTKLINVPRYHAGYYVFLGVCIYLPLLTTLLVSSGM